MVLIHRLSDLIFKFEKVLAVVFCGILLVTLFAGVAFRYFLNSPLSWSDEIAIFSLVWLTFIGGSMGIKLQRSAAVTILMDKVQGRLKTVLLVISTLAVFLFGCYIFALSVKWIMSPTILFQKSNSLQLPMIIPYLSVPVGFFFILIHSLDLVLKTFRTTEKEA
ncbi:TRAP transporter small permease [Ammoniphilus sp. 3BR4]|uniref:TRAP transporter small permease n=1 Tax=Ammoniphilus sp. 3BR4 TaxID=3158265 RepID=UPI003466E3AA